MSNSTTLDYQVSVIGTATALLPQAGAITANQPITFLIPFLYTGGVDYQSYSYSNNSFQFQLTQANYGPPPGTQLIFVSITIAATAWGTNRSALMTDFTDFLQNIETQFETQGILSPGATSRIGQQIADCMPAPLIETLFYRYSLSQGFAPGTRPYIDIRPGMRLRVETEISQYLAAGSSLNGYVGGGSSYFSVGSAPAANGKRVLTFDPFLSAIKSPKVSPPPNQPTTQPLVAGGVVDLQGSAAAQKYWRFVLSANDDRRDAGRRFEPG